MAFETIMQVWVFIFGTLVGSFINVCIYRLPRMQSIVFPGSFCQACGTPLSWWQNVPLLSFLFLRGKCAKCGTPYSGSYLGIEFLLGVLTLAGWLKFNNDWYSMAYYYFFIIIAVIIFFIDLRHWLILDPVIYAGFITGIMLTALRPVVTGAAFSLNMFIYPVLGCAVGFLLFYGIAVLGSWFARQEAMGYGDVKFAALIGFFLGWERALQAFFLAFILGGIFAVFYLVIRRKSGKEPIPFGTFMAAASILVIFYGDSFRQFYGGGYF